MDTRFNICMRHSAFFTCAVGLLLAITLVFATGCDTSHDHAPATDPASVTEYTCSMHPQIRQPQMGSCPICGMDLIPVESDTDDASEREWSVTLSPTARARAQIETTPVTRMFVPVNVRLSGKVVVDETRIAHITARVPGRLDQLYINYTGVDVMKDEHLVLLYSQELYVKQAEYLIARSTGVSGAPAGRQRLLLAGMTEEQVEELERTGDAQLYVTLYAPLSGTVIEKNGVEGMYVDIGTPIFTVADLSHLWVVLDAYESDLPWLRYGQKAVFSTEAYSGITFTGQVAFISPVVNELTRTVQVRLNVDNAARTLKPGFLVRAHVHATVAGAGRVVEPELADKWICPMHPEIIADDQEDCPDCGMPLESLESLGYTEVDIDTAPLVIPATAPLITGTRAIVYVEDTDEAGTFEGREVTLGPRAGDFYIVEHGLEEDEHVVTKGNFKIDSTMQLRAKRSMMTPHDEPAPIEDTTQDVDVDLPASFHRHFTDLINRYLKVSAALSRDDLEEARENTLQLTQTLHDMHDIELPDNAYDIWATLQEDMTHAAEIVQTTDDIDIARDGFHDISNSIIAMIRAFGLNDDITVYVVHCPMAFDFAGADWLQDTRQIANPYFGSEMLNCGSITETFESTK